MLWGIRHGQFTEVFTGQPWLAYHWEPILVPIAFVDAILPSPEWLLVLQTLALAAAAWPAWRIGRRLLGDDLGGLCAVAAVLLYPVVGQANVFELHPVTFAVAPGLWLLDALAEGKTRAAWIAGILVCACREDGFLLAAFALLATGWSWRRAALAVGAMTAYVGWAFVLAPRLGTLASAQAHFGWLGGSPAAIVGTMARDPLLVLGHVTGAPQREYLLGLLAPLAFLPLLAPRRMLAALPTIGLNLLSGLPDATRIIDCHYSSLAVPGLIFAALCGAERLAGWTRPWIARTVIGVAALAGAFLLGPLPGERGHAAELYTLDNRANRLDGLVAQIPKDASAAAPPDVVAHLAGREVIEIFPRGLGAVDYALVDMEPRPIRGVTPEEQRARLRQAVTAALDNGYRIADADGELILLARGQAPPGQ
jgi:uncharacterized membrane protein